jgi:hypothetical protein
MVDPMAVFRLEDLVEFVHAQQPNSDPLRRVREAAGIANNLVSLGDALVDAFVDEARQAGASWTEIGQTLGVSKQAAQKRFMRNELASGRAAADPQLFGRFTDRAKAAVAAACKEARRAADDEVNSAHLVLGLLNEPQSMAAKAIVEGCGMPINAVRQAVNEVLPPPLRKPPKQVPFSNDSKLALDATLRATLRLGQNFVGTEHLLLGILDEYEGLGGQALLRMGIDPDWAEEWIIGQQKGLR